MSTVSTKGGRGSRGGPTEWLRKQAGRVGDGATLPVSTEDNLRFGVEAWLQVRGVQYAPAAQIPMALIDTARSRANQARQQAILSESVDRYAVAMRAGVQFPPIVVYPDSGKLIIVDGNNRQAGATRAGLDQILGIIISEDTPSELVQLLTVEANARHGVTPDLGWRIHQAFGLVAQGWPDQAAADATALSITQLRSARTVADCEDRARALKIPGFVDLPATSKVALSPIKDVAVFKQLARMAIDTAMTTDELREVTRVVKSEHSEAGRLDYLNSVAKDRAKARSLQRATATAPGQIVRVRSLRVELLAALGKIASVDPTTLAKQVLTRGDRDTILRRIEDNRTRLNLIESAVKSLSLGADDGGAAVQ